MSRSATQCCWPLDASMAICDHLSCRHKGGAVGAIVALLDCHAFGLRDSAPLLRQHSLRLVRTLRIFGSSRSVESNVITPNFTISRLPARYRVGGQAQRTNSTKSDRFDARCRSSFQSGYNTHRSSRSHYQNNNGCGSRGVHSFNVYHAI